MINARKFMVHHLQSFIPLLLLLPCFLPWFGIPSNFPILPCFTCNRLIGRLSWEKHVYNTIKQKHGICCIKPWECVRFSLSWGILMWDPYGDTGGRSSNTPYRHPALDVLLRLDSVSASYAIWPLRHCVQQVHIYARHTFSVDAYREPFTYKR